MSSTRKSLIVCILLICIFYIHSHGSNVCHTGKKNKYENFSGEGLHHNRLTKNFTTNSQKITYLFCSGGYDSIYQLCHLTLHEKKIVQPMYLNMEDLDGDTKRKNTHYELKSIQNAINEITRAGYGKHVLPVRTFENFELPKRIKEAGEYFHSRGEFSRPITQYVYMAGISYAMKTPIETGILCSPTGAIYKSLGNIINYQTKMINPKIADKHQILFRYLKFPLCGISKRQMMKKSKRLGFFHILQKSISCWFPKNGSPCGECRMCQERII